MFEKFKKLSPKPLGYWEEKSYMQVLSRDNSDYDVKNIAERIKNLKEVEVTGENFQDNKILYIDLKYQNENYKIGFFPNIFVFSDLYLNNPLYLSENEVQEIRNSKMGITMFMEFNKDSKKSFHLQIKVALAIAPNMICVLDESAERILPFKWVMMTANSKVLPGPNDLYTVQAVTDKSGEVWLHTHGLCRCGLTELEILQSDTKNYSTHHQLLLAYGSFLIDKKEGFDINSKKGVLLGVLVNRMPIVVTCRIWTEGIKEYKNLKLGNLKDREEAHNSRTSIIFIYKTEEDEKKEKISKLSEYNDLLGENSMFFISDEETERMKNLAMERFDFVKEAKENGQNAIVKIGLPTDDGESFEHIWYDIIEFKDNKFKAKLLQEPYNVKDKHEGDEDWFTVKDVTDWIIYMKNLNVQPTNAYVLLK